MKLSKTQQEVIDRAKANINEARTLGFTEWFRVYASSYWRDKSDDEIVSELKQEIYRDGTSRYDFWITSYNEEKDGITLVQCNSRTLYKLQELGAIEILREGRSRCDKIKLLNY